MAPAQCGGNESAANRHNGGVTKQMSVESAADRLAFLADFGVSASWTVGVTSTTLTGILHAGTVRIAADDGADVLNIRASLQVRSADVPGGAGEGDAVSLSAVAYTVKSIEPDGTGMTVVLLEQAVED